MPPQTTTRPLRGLIFLNTNPAKWKELIHAFEPNSDQPMGHGLPIHEHDAFQSARQSEFNREFRQTYMDTISGAFDDITLQKLFRILIKLHPYIMQLPTPMQRFVHKAYGWDLDAYSKWTGRMEESDLRHRKLPHVVSTFNVHIAFLPAAA